MAQRKINGCKIWMVECAMDDIAKGRLTYDELLAKNPKLAGAVTKLRKVIEAERAAEVPYSLNFWDKNGEARVYVNGGLLAQARDFKVWFIRRESSSIHGLDWEIKGYGDWYHCPSLSRLSSGGAKPWESLAEEALAELGRDIRDVTFDDLISLARR